MSQLPPFSLPGIVLAASLAIFSHSGVPSSIYKMTMTLNDYSADLKLVQSNLSGLTFATRMLESSIMVALIPSFVFNVSYLSKAAAFGCW